MHDVVTRVSARVSTPTLRRAARSAVVEHLAAQSRSAVSTRLRAHPSGCGNQLLVPLLCIPILIDASIVTADDPPDHLCGASQGASRLHSEVQQVTTTTLHDAAAPLVPDLRSTPCA